MEKKDIQENFVSDEVLVREIKTDEVMALMQFDD